MDDKPIKCLPRERQAIGKWISDSRSGVNARSTRLNILSTPDEQTDGQMKGGTEGGRRGGRVGRTSSLLGPVAIGSRKRFQSDREETT